MQTYIQAHHVLLALASNIVLLKEIWGDARSRSTSNVRNVCC